MTYLIRNRVLSDKSIKFYITFAKLTVKLKLDLLKRIALVSMGQNCGIYLEVISSPSVLFGGKVADAYGCFKIRHILYYYQSLAILCPLLDLFFVRMLSFVHRCLRSESPLVNLWSVMGYYIDKWIPL